jgi:hypothetical protein
MRKHVSISVSPLPAFLRRGPFAVVALAMPLAAQCGQWVPGDGVPGVNGRVHAMTMWDRDGAGPAAPVLAVAGEFTLAGSVAANHVATYDPVARTWAALGSGTNSAVYALAALPSGELVIGGGFFSAGGNAALAIARWSGSGWSPLGAGLNDSVQALVVANGELFAAGYFTASGSQPLARIARWNGSTWSALGAGCDNAVAALTTDATGGLIAAGYFGTAGGAPANRIARWNGSSWAALGSGCDGPVFALAAAANGEIFAGGDFDLAGGIPAQSLARWNGSSWAALGGGVSGAFGEVRALLLQTPGELVVGGTFTAAGASAARGVARWNGAAWSALAGGLTAPNWETTLALATLPNGDLIAGGSFTRIGDKFASSLARFDGVSWSRPSPGGVGGASTFLPLADGRLLAGGRMQSPDGAALWTVAAFDGASWATLGAGLGGTGPFDGVRQLAQVPGGDILASGYFTGPFGSPLLSRLWRWDGGAWQPFGNANGDVNTLLSLPGGDLLVGGNFSQIGGLAMPGLARLTGSSSTTWQAVAGIAGVVQCAALAANGDLFVGGTLALNGGASAPRIARWNGSAWSSIASFAPSELAVMASGDLVATDYAQPIRRWNGVTWTDLLPGSHVVAGLCNLPNGDLLAAGQFDLPVAVDEVRRWNGSSWARLGGNGVQAFGGPLAALPAGEVAFGGTVVEGGAVVSGFARYRSTCPATAVANGSGCPGSGGPTSYAATALPWLGATFRARGSNLPTNALVVVVTGFGTVDLPLPYALPPSAASCRLLVTPDALAVAVASGTLDTALAVPNVSTLLGLVVHEQLVAFAITGAQWTATTSSNALSLTLGTY